MGLVNIQYLKACVAYLKLGGIVEYDLCNTNRENLRGRPNKQRAKRQQKRGKKQQTR